MLALEDFEEAARRYAATDLRLHLGRRRNQRVAARQSRGVRRDRVRAADAGGHVRALDEDDALRPHLRRAVRHRADGRHRHGRLPGRRRARARRGGSQHADDHERLVADAAGGRARSGPDRVVPGLPSGRRRPHHAARRARGARRLRHAGADRRRAGAGQPREQREQRLHTRRCARPCGSRGTASSGRAGSFGMFLRTLLAPRHAALREHGPRAFPLISRTGGARARAARQALLEARRADAAPVEGPARGEGHTRPGRRPHRARERRRRRHRVQPRRAPARRRGGAAARAAGNRRSRRAA